MGGTNEPDNLIEVTIEEHTLIHYNLWKLDGRWQDELAYRCLSGQVGKEEAIRIAASCSMKNRRGEKHYKEWNINIKRGNCKRWWEITDPEGNIYYTMSLTSFCKNHDLNQGNMSHHGYHKNWECRTISYINN